VRDLRAVSLFAGAGGLDYGFEAAGFSTKLAIEIDPVACATLARNRPQWSVLRKQIQHVSGKELTDALDMDEREVDLVTGGPPCQPFSKAGYWATGDTQRLADPRAETLASYMRVVGELLPRAFVLENVPGISYAGKDEGLRLIERWVRKINSEHGTDYALSFKVVNAAEYGVPQLRTRFVMVGDRDGKQFSFPAATHHLPSSRAGKGDLPGPVTAWDAIGHLDVTTEDDLAVPGYWGKLLPSIPEGENYLHHTSKGAGMRLFGYRTRYWGFLLKLAKSKPSWTLQAQPGPAIGPFHWRSRRLSVEEMAQLQTFPRGIKFSGNYCSVRRQIGNAVPSLMAEVVAREVARQIFRERGLGGLRLMVEPRWPIPDPEEVLPVPTTYLKHVGDHPDHPGVGNGPGVKHRDVEAAAA
jgi:DNA (cytosine-5)-methyltransferase 1